MNLKDKTKKLPWFAIAMLLCVLAASWQFAAIRKELSSLKTEVALAKNNALAATSSNDSDNSSSEQELEIRNLK